MDGLFSQCSDFKTRRCLQVSISNYTLTISLAVVLWELYTHNVPFEKYNDWQIYKLQWTEKFPFDYLPIPNECPYYLRLLLIECWSREVAKRPTMDKIYQTLCREDDIQLSEQESILQKNFEMPQEKITLITGISQRGIMPQDKMTLNCKC